MMSPLSALWIVLLLCCSAFFAACEAAYSSVNALRLKRSGESGDRLARLAYTIHERFDSAISAILIGNNAVSIAASSFATVVVVGIMGESGVWVVSIAMTLLVLFFAEITPKIIARQQRDGFVRVAARPLYALMWALKPLSAATNFLVDKLSARVFKNQAEDEPAITEEEFSAILDTVENEGVMDEDRTELLQSALSFDETTVQQIMRPRIDMVAVDIDDELDEIVREVLESGYSRIPVYEDKIDNIIGVLHVNHFLEEMVDTGTADIRAQLLQPLFLHMTMTLDAALKQFQKKHIHIAIVLDEYGGTLGMVTLEDLLEQLVGEIWDEGDDVVEECRELSEDVYECSGMMNTQEFFDFIDFYPADFDSEYVTLGGWAVEMLDAEPAEGKEFSYERLRVTVTKMEGLRVLRLRIEVGKAEE